VGEEGLGVKRTDRIEWKGRGFTGRVGEEAFSADELFGLAGVGESHWFGLM
jgi:hypothetical protein